MPWVPELFSAPALESVLEKREQPLIAVPYFDGFVTGEPEALIESFGGEPEVHVPVRGRVKGTRAFAAFASETRAWLKRHDVSVEDVEHVITERHGFEEVILHLDGESGRVDLPLAIVADRRPDRRIDELRMYFSNRALRGRHADRPPLLQLDPDMPEGGVVGEYQRALAAGDVEAILAAFEPDGYARDAAGATHVHGARENLRSFYELLFSNGGGIELERCAVIDDGHACALEYNVVRWGRTELAPQAGLAVYARGPGGRLAAARTYDDVDRPLRPAS
jgi:hypothetical protein